MIGLLQIKDIYTGRNIQKIRNASFRIPLPILLCYPYIEFKPNNPFIQLLRECLDIEVCDVGQISGAAGQKVHDCSFMKNALSWHINYLNKSE
ncbi:MAG TPA: hypothetical protein DET40_14395 [Lentisphaeria bacterium]|nr:MAG: hypothetical protein A2X45_05570 [Lentisphaerae bacterium GWF2_50_93]HCE44728.1 hypothetical protein [Lentisphaeria bacterium]